jgi:hypothetical protein
MTSWRWSAQAAGLHRRWPPPSDVTICLFQTPATWSASWSRRSGFFPSGALSLATHKRRCESRELALEVFKSPSRATAPPCSTICPQRRVPRLVGQVGPGTGRTCSSTATGRRRPGSLNTGLGPARIHLLVSCRPSCGRRCWGAERRPSSASTISRRIACRLTPVPMNTAPGLNPAGPWRSRHEGPSDACSPRCQAFGDVVARHLQLRLAHRQRCLADAEGSVERHAIIRPLSINTDARRHSRHALVLYRPAFSHRAGDDSHTVFR